MGTPVHVFAITLSWDLIQSVSTIERFDSAWDFIEKREGPNLDHMKSLAILRSTGASARIAGSKMNDEQVEILLRDKTISKPGDDRDSREAAGYYDALNFVLTSYDKTDITEKNFKYLHNILLESCQKDQWHKGDYKQNNNTVEALLADGTKRIIYQTTEPGIATENAMRDLIQWYNKDDKIHPMVKCAAFVYGFFRIHPFQDGNGRMSRLLSSLLLMKLGYKWIQYTSLDHELENKRVMYYQELRKYPFYHQGEDISSWISFFFDALKNAQQQLLQKLHNSGAESQLSSRERSILVLIGDFPGCSSGKIAERSGIPGPTVKRLLTDLCLKNLIKRSGSGPATNYSIK